MVRRRLVAGFALADFATGLAAPAGAREGLGIPSKVYVAATDMVAISPGPPPIGAPARVADRT